MQEALGRAEGGDGVQLVLVGFSPPARLQAIVRRLGFDGPVLGDESRELYRRLGVGRAPLWRVYSPGTLRTYARDLLPGTRRRSRLPVRGEDTRQLGADAILVEGSVRVLWRPRSPDARPSATEVIAAALEFPRRRGSPSAPPRPPRGSDR